MNAIDAIKKFENHLALVKNRRPNTVRSYTADAALLYRFVTTGKLGQRAVKLPLLDGEAFDWANFTEDNAVEYMGALRKADVKDTSIQRKVYALKQFFKFLRKHNITTADPWGDIETHAVQRKLPPTLTIDEMNRLLNAIREPVQALLGVPRSDVFQTIRDRAMLETLYGAALRVSELVGANWQDLNWNARELTVTGKGNKTRIVPLGQKALEALLEYSRHYEQQWGKKPNGPAPMFLSTWNSRMNQRTVPRLIRKWCERAGVKRINPHAFRHSAATHMLENGADVRVIQRLLGHASISTTEIYTHVAVKKIKTVHASTHPRA